MTKQTINYGAAGSGSGGDTARTALQKLEANFNEIFSSAGSAANAKALNELAGDADRLPYFCGVGVLSLATLTARARTLLAAADQAGQLAAIGLGNAALATIMASLSDTTAGRLMPVGAFGLGSIDVSDVDLNTVRASGFCIGNANTIPGVAAQLTITLTNAATHSAQMGFAQDGNRAGFRTSTDTAWNAWLEFLHTGNAAALPISSALAANADNVRTLGTAALRWSTVYAGTGTINTSDAREKTEVRALTDGEIAAARQLSQAVGAYKFLAAVAEKGSGARDHIGLTVQRAIEILQANGLDPFNYGFICYDSWPQETVDHPATYEQIPVTDADGNVTGYENGALIKEAWTEVTQEAGDRYSFRTDELNLFIARGQAAYLAQLEARIAALEPTA